jgi:hypothetical protein
MAALHSPAAAACQEVERACRLLETPTAAQLDASANALAVAVDRLRSLSGACGAVTQAEALRLQQALRRAKLLLHYANEYHSCWNRILQAISGGYTPQGVAEPLWLTARFSGEG